MFPIELLGVKTNPAKSAPNLGVIFNKNFTFDHISLCFYHMRDLRRIRRHFDLDSAKLLATALVSSRLDYCNLHWPHKASSVSRINWPAWWQSLLHLLAAFCCFVPIIGCQFRKLFKINWLTYKTLLEKTACLSSLHACHIDSFPFTDIKQW